MQTYKIIDDYNSSIYTHGTTLPNDRITFLRICEIILKHFSDVGSRRALFLKYDLSGDGSMCLKNSEVASQLGKSPERTRQMLEKGLCHIGCFISDIKNYRGALRKKYLALSKEQEAYLKKGEEEFERRLREENSIALLGISQGPANALYNSGIFTIDDLAKCTRSKLGNFRGLGTKGFEEIRDKYYLFTGNTILDE